jgi:hypothetical protein
MESRRDDEQQSEKKTRQTFALRLLGWGMVSTSVTMRVCSAMCA